MPELFLAIGLVLLVIFVILSVSGRERKPGRKRPTGLAGALGVFNELYQPSAKNAAVIVEEQQQSRKQAGNEGKKKPRHK